MDITTRGLHMRTPEAGSRWRTLWRALVGALMLAWLMGMSSAALAATPDTNAPVLRSLTLTPATVNVAGADAVVTVEARITDDNSGCTWAVLTCQSVESPDQSFSVVLERISGTSKDGVYRARGSIGRYASPGTWRVSLMRLDDVANNTRFYQPEDLEASGFNTDVTVTNASRPPIRVTYARFANPIAYVTGSLKTSKFSTKVNTPGVTAIVKLGTSVIYRRFIPTANVNYDFPPWNGIVAGKKLAPGNYGWTLTLSKSGYPSRTVRGTIAVANRYGAISGVGSGTGPGTTKKYSKALVAGSLTCVVNAVSSSTVSKYVRLAVTRAPLYWQSVGAWTVRSAIPLGRTVSLTGAHAPKVAGIYTVSVTAPAGVTYSIRVLQ